MIVFFFALGCGCAFLMGYSIAQMKTARFMINAWKLVQEAMVKGELTPWVYNDAFSHERYEKTPHFRKGDTSAH